MTRKLSNLAIVAGLIIEAIVLAALIITAIAILEMSLSAK